jgi:hypothetical protein
MSDIQTIKNLLNQDDNDVTLADVIKVLKKFRKILLTLTEKIETRNF